MSKIDLTKKELEFIQECIYQCIVNQDDLLSDYMKSNHLTDDELYDFSVDLREKLDRFLQREYHIY